MTQRDHNFGGEWTDQKVVLVRQYLEAYTTALKKTSFKLVYIDAFAGTGYRTVSRTNFLDGRLFDLPELDELVKGSARVALEIKDRPFDEFVFIEKNKSRFKGLTGLRDEFPSRASKMRFLNEDANSAIVRLCAETDWRRTRAVLFLDPCGMQVEWRTIEAIAKTRSIDLWYLFPHSMGIVRMTPRTGEVPEPWQKRLDLVCGEPAWRDVFFRRFTETDLFGEETLHVQKLTDVENVERYLLQRLGSIFAGVASKAGQLRNSRNQCMYLLAFAVGNPSGKAIAIRIAKHLIDGFTGVKRARVNG